MFKTVSRSIRTEFLRNSPYFAHLSVTHDCNLRCRYCHIWEQKSPEASLEDTKKIIDRLDEMGIALLSITGGEPLLRKDIYQIIDYAKSKGLYVRLTSNGTLPLEKYKRLLDTKIDAIAISLDGISGDDLPHSKRSPSILKTLDYLLEHKGKKTLSLSTLMHQGNEKDIKAVIDYAKTRLHGTRVFVQPVVVGSGKLRVATQKKVNPSVLKKIDTLDPPFFVDACVKYSTQDRFEWQCLAGELFFDIQPNGDFWICQDYPTKLNILDKHFMQDWKKADFRRLRNGCKGCTYSCYYMTQKAFEPRYWPQMLGLYSSYSRK